MDGAVDLLCEGIYRKYEQLNSLENQVQYYTELIQSKANWVYIEGYDDKGISGTSTKKRDSFNRMIADAKAGRFYFIIYERDITLGLAYNNVN